MYRGSPLSMCWDYTDRVGVSVQQNERLCEMMCFHSWIEQYYKLDHSNITRPWGVILTLRRRRRHPGPIASRYCFYVTKLKKDAIENRTQKLNLTRKRVQSWKRERCRILYFTFDCWCRCTLRAFNSSYDARLGALYGPILVYSVPPSVHCSVNSVFKGTINVKPLHHGQ
jgi:hypothetical protein